MSQKQIRDSPDDDNPKPNMQTITVAPTDPGNQKTNKCCWGHTHIVITVCIHCASQRTRLFFDRHENELELCPVNM